MSYKLTKYVMQELDDPRLDHASWSILVLLTSYVNQRTGDNTCWPSMETLSRRSRISREWICKKIIPKLVKLGYLVVLKNYKGRSNGYRLTIDVAKKHHRLTTDVAKKHQTIVNSVHNTADSNVNSVDPIVNSVDNDVNSVHTNRVLTEKGTEGETDDSSPISTGSRFEYKGLEFNYHTSPDTDDKIFDTGRYLTVKATKLRDPTGPYNSSYTNSDLECIWVYLKQRIGKYDRAVVTRNVSMDLKAIYTATGADKYIKAINMLNKFSE